MINLLPTNVMQDLSYARRSRVLLHWNGILLGLLMIILLVAGGGYLYINRTIKIYEKQVNNARASLKEQKLEETQAQVQSISNNVTLINQVLSKQVLFSKLLKELGTTMPSGAVLERLELTGETSGALDLSALAKDFGSATQVPVNFADSSNKLFEKVDTLSVTCSDPEDRSVASGLSAQYPCRVSVRVLFKKDNQFLLIGSKTPPTTTTGATP